MMTCLALFWEFFKIGLFAVGGGTATIPFLMDLAERVDWYTTQELLDMIAISQSTPGPIGVNMATYVGYTTAGVPGAVITKKECGSQAAFEAQIQAVLERNGTDLIILAGFMCILSENFTSKWPKRILNVHPSLIPSFCGEGFYGLRVHQAALDYGVKVTGATVHFVNEIPDGGEIIAQKAVSIEPGDTPEILQKRVMEQAEWILLPQAAEMVCASMEEM